MIVKEQTIKMSDRARNFIPLLACCFALQSATWANNSQRTRIIAPGDLNHSDVQQINLVCASELNFSSNNGKEQAIVLLKQAAESYRHLTTYLGTIAVEVETKETTAQLRAQVALDSSSHCAVVLHEGDPDSIRTMVHAQIGLSSATSASIPSLMIPRRVIADGKQIITTFSKSGDRYRQLPLAPGLPVAYVTMEQSRLLSISMLARFLAGADPTPHTDDVADVALTTPTSINGVPVDVVVVTVDRRGPDAPSRRAGLSAGFRNEETTRYFIGQQDHLLRACVRTVVNGTRTVTYTETFTNISINQPLDEELFRFTPPPGAVDILQNKVKIASSQTSRLSQAGTSRTAPAARPDDVTAVKMASVPLQVLPVSNRDAIEVLGPGRARFDFGSVALLDKMAMQGVFLVKNTSDAPVKLRKLSVSCGCLTIRGVGSTNAPPPSGSELTASFIKLPYTLKPGEQIPVEVTADLTRVPPGPLHGKYGYVWVDGEEAPAARLEIRGDVKPVLEFSPSAITFGPVKSGKPRSTTITAAFDPRLLPAGSEEPQLASFSNGITVAPLPSTASQSSAKEGALPAGWVTRRYEVSVAPDAPLGFVQSQLLFSRNETDAPKSDVEQRRQAALLSAFVSVTARVTGDVILEPDSLTFGNVKQGAETTRRLVLRAAPGITLDGVRIASGSPWLAIGLWMPETQIRNHAKAVKQGSARPTPDRAVEITVLPNAPAGSLQAELLLTLRSGQKIIVPVSGFVQPDNPGTSSPAGNENVPGTKAAPQNGGKQ